MTELFIHASLSAFFAFIWWADEKYLPFVTRFVVVTCALLNVAAAVRVAVTLRGAQ